MEGLLRCISVNTEHRSKYPNDPSKFQESELSLAESIHQLQDLLTSDPSPDTCIACIDPLVQLLGHDNLDIAGAAIQAIEQLVQTQQQLEAVVQEVVNKGAVHLLVENLSRLGQQVDDDDLDTFDRTLNVLEIIVDIVPMVADVLVAETSVCEILIRKIEEEEEEEEEDGVFDELQLFSSEILAILFQTAGSSQVKNVIERRPDDIKRITNVLKRYVGKDPGSESEKEFASNLINILSSILLFHSDAQVLFANAGGLELALNLIRKKTFGRTAGLKLINIALQNCFHNCEVFVQISGLKTLFACLMKPSKLSKKYGNDPDEEEEYVVFSILYLFISLGNVEYRRLLKKFHEKEFEKVVKLVELHERYQLKCKQLDEDSEERDAALVILEGIDTVIALICSAGDNLLLDAAVKSLNAKGCSLSEVKITLTEFSAKLGQQDAPPENSVQLKDIVEKLINLI